jgi:hypothetical protein
LVSYEACPSPSFVKEELTKSPSLAHAFSQQAGWVGRPSEIAQSVVVRSPSVFCGTYTVITGALAPDVSLALNFKDVVKLSDSQSVTVVPTTASEWQQSGLVANPVHSNAVADGVPANVIVTLINDGVRLVNILLNS